MGATDDTALLTLSTGAGKSFFGRRGQLAMVQELRRLRMVDPRWRQRLVGLDVVGRAIIQRTRAGTQGATASRHSTPLLCTDFRHGQGDGGPSARRWSWRRLFRRHRGGEDAAYAEHIEALLHGCGPGTAFVPRARAGTIASEGWQ